MADRTVNVRLNLDVSSFNRGATQAEQGTARMAQSAERAAAQAQSAATRSATAAGGTFSSVSRQAATSLQGMERAATRSSQALTSSSRTMTAETARAAAAATRTTQQAAASAERATTSAAAATTAATERVARAATEIPATFRAAGAAGTAAMGEISTAATASSLAMARTETTITAATAAAATGTAQLSLASRLALAEAAQASQAAAAASARAAAAQRTAMGRMQAQTAAWAASSRAQAASVGRSMVTAATTSTAAWKGMRTVSLGLLAVFAGAVYTAAKFEKAMSGVAAVSGATGDQLESLRQAALDAGKATQYSASQAADAEAELARAGVSASDIVGGALTGALSLAAAGQLDLTEAATDAAQAMGIFGLRGKDVGHIADLLAAGANKSATDVHGLGLALRQGGLVAHQTGLSIEDTTGALAAFAQAGLVGSDAGTSLKTMLQRLTPQSAEAQATMDKLGFSAYNSQGNFVGLSQMAQNLQNSFKGLTPEARNAAFGVIFGSDAIRGASILYSQGAAGVTKWTDAVNDQGAAARTAAKMTDNLSGDFEKLKSSLEGALIESGTAANGVLRDMVKWITGLINAYNNLPDGLKQTVTAFAGITGAVGLVAAGFFLAIPKIVGFRTAVTELAVTMPRLATAASATTSFIAGPWGLAIGAGIAALTLFGGAHKKAKPDVEALTGAIQADSGTVGENTRAWAANELEKDGALRGAQKLGINTKTLTDAVLGNKDALAIVTRQMKPYQAAVGDLSGKSSDLDKIQSKVNDTFGGGKKGFDDFQSAVKAVNGAVTQTAPAFDDASEAAKREAKATGVAGDAAQQTKEDVQDERTEVEKLTEALDNLNGTNIDAASAAISYQGSLGDLQKAVKENGTSLDITTEKGRAVKQAFLDAAQAAQKHAEAVTNQTGSVADGNAVLAQDVEQLKKTMSAAGFTKQQIDSLTKAYSQLPASKTTTVTAPTAKKTIADLERVKSAVANIPAGKSVTTKAITKDAEKNLEDLGYKVTHLKNGSVRVTVPTSDAYNGVAHIQGRVDSLRGKTLAVYVEEHIRAAGGRDSVLSGSYGSANGNIFKAYASGGVEQHIAQIAPGGAMRLWAEPETGGEAYIPLAASKRGRSQAILAEVAKKFGYRLDKFATGGFSYAPTDALSTFGVGSGQDRYSSALQKLADAVDKLHSATTKQEKAAAQKAVAAANATLGLSKSNTSTGFNLTSYQRFLAQANSANTLWEKNLASIGKKAGGDVEETLRGMGEEGKFLVDALAHASTKQFNSIVANLKALAPTAKATLTDFTNQLKSATTTSQTFQANLLKLASMGDTALATQLAAQGDDTAAAVAAAAVKDSKTAATANAAAQSSAALLTGEDLANAVTLLGVLRGKSNAGIADVLATGLDWGTVQALAPKVMSQINALPAANKTTFLKQLAGQAGGVAMADGGILRSPMVLAGERGTEAYIPLNGSARSMGLLTTTANLMGYGLVPAGRFATAGGGGSAGPTHVDQSRTVVLHGAKQTTGEQAADILRRMTPVG